MAGGSGTRLWPLSREALPKQFLAIDNSGKSLLQNTLIRLSAFEGIEFDLPLIICNEQHRFIVAEQLRQIGKLGQNIILEPIAKNTAPAIAIAAHHLASQVEDDPVLLILPADHLIQDTTAFLAAVKIAYEQAMNSKLVTFGIIPTYAETGYGYIKKGNQIDISCYEVDSFHEKPSLDVAVQYIASQNYCWNSGMFLFKTSVFVNELKLHSPDIYINTQKSVSQKKSDMDFIRIDKSNFELCRSDSIDIAIMEKTLNAVMLPIDVGWSDIGSWLSLWEVSPKDTDGNAISGSIVAKNTANSYLFSNAGIVATVGLQDIVVVNTPDAVLVANKNNVQQVKDVVEFLKNNNIEQYKNNPIIYKPWGKSETLKSTSEFEVIKLTVYPNKQISNQRHNAIIEHWVVLAGQAEIIIGDNKFIVGKNESIFCPKLEFHSIKNIGNIDLKIIEIREGDFLSFEDIERKYEHK